MAELLTNTLPYLLIGLKIGIERAFPLTGLISGACQREAILKPMIVERCLGNLILEIRKILTTMPNNDRGSVFETKLSGVVRRR